MNIVIKPGKLSGTIAAIPSKSQAHRLLICAAFSDLPTELICPETNRDIEATAACLNSLGAVITRTSKGYMVYPAETIPDSAQLECQESGSTLRFLLPIVGALGVDAVFHLKGRLPYRPLSPLWEEMERMGCTLSRSTESTIRCTGKLVPGNYTIAGNVSSQFISGLLFATSLMEGNSHITITGTLESQPYVAMTQLALSQFGKISGDCRVAGGRPFHSPRKISVEGDWSNAAFFLAAKAFGSPIAISGLNSDSPQGDRAAEDLIHQLCHGHLVISAADIPDLVPILSVVAAANHGAVFTHTERLRLKESDRVAAVISMLSALGIYAEASENTLTVFPGRFHGGTVDAVNDHRIAMSAAIAATVADGPVTILGANCVEKSYPIFWQEFQKLGGQYEQYIR